MRMSPFLSSRPPMTISEPVFPFDAGKAGGGAGEGASRLAAARPSARRFAAGRLRLFATEHHFAIGAAQERRACDDATVAHQDTSARNDVNGFQRARPECDQVGVGTSGDSPFGVE